MISNGAIALFALIAFLAFGYFSLLRIITRQYFSARSIKTAAKCLFTDTRVLANLGSSALFVSLPATSLLLFWGWAPALIWLLITHLLIDSIFHLQISAAEQISLESTALVRSKKPSHKALETLVVQAFYILLTAIVLALMATLIDRQSGLLFALVSLLPAHQVLRSGRLSGIAGSARIIGAVAVLAIGIVFAHQLGISIYGDWPPFGEFLAPVTSWLVFNNQTIIAGALLIGAVQLSANQPFEKDFATLAGLLLVSVTLALLAQFIWLQPLLDAPLNLNTSATTEPIVQDLPSFLIVSFLAFWSLGGLLLRLTNERDGLNKQGEISARFGRLQWEGILQLLFSVVLFLSLAAAIGIGAWNTHYQGSFLAQDLTQHFTLAVSAISALFNQDGSTGTFVSTLFLVGLSITGFSFLVACTQRLGLDWSAVKGTDRKSSVAQALVAFLVTCFFISRGIDIEFWVILGVLAWILITHQIVGACLAVKNLQPGSSNGLFATVMALALVVLGSLQCIALSVYLYLSGLWLVGLVLIALLLIGTVLWWRGCIELVEQLRTLGQAKRIT